MFKKEKIGKTNTNLMKEAKVLFFLFILLFILISIILLTFSKIKIQIVNLVYTSNNIRHINKDYEIIIKLCILGKIPILKINITKTKLERLKLKQKIENIDLKIMQNKNGFDKNILKALKELNLQIKNINLKIEIGTESASLTSIIIPTISTIIAIFLRNKIEKYENQTFIVNPVYINQNIVKVLLSGIFEIKMIHIINIIYILNKKEGVDKNERTSNRGAYDYSYE